MKVCFPDLNLTFKNEGFLLDRQTIYNRKAKWLSQATQHMTDLSIAMYRALFLASWGHKHTKMQPSRVFSLTDNGAHKTADLPLGGRHDCEASSARPGVGSCSALAIKEAGGTVGPQPQSPCWLEY